MNTTQTVANVATSGRRTVADLMSAPVISTPADVTLAEAGRAMMAAGVGSVVVVDSTGVPVGILTERDLVRATEASADPDGAAVSTWMTAAPEMVRPDTPIDDALERLAQHGYRHLPVLEDGALVGIVSMRDLMRVASIRPAGEPAAEVPKGLKGVVVTETAIGDVRGAEGFFHYRQYSAIDLAEQRSLEDVWALLFDGALPTTRAESAAFAEQIVRARHLPSSLDRLLRAVATGASGSGPLDGLRTMLSAVGAARSMRPVYDLGPAERRADALTLASVTPTIVAALHRLGAGGEPIAPRPDLGHAANYLWMCHGVEAPPELARAIEQYLILTMDHGFNASTFTARVIASTGADVAASVVGAIGALSGPLHGGAPSRALDTLDAIGTPDRAPQWIRDAVERGERIMGFGHALYRTDDPRSLLLRRIGQQLGGDRVDFAVAVEREIVDTLAELKPGRQLYPNVEFYAGVVMERCGLPPELFTPTFAVSRVIGWCANVLEQADDNRIIRPSARYVGPEPPQPVPAAP